MLVLPRETYSRLWQDPAVSAIGVYIEKDYSPDQVITAVKQSLGEVDVRIRVRANREIRESELLTHERCER